MFMIFQETTMYFCEHFYSSLNIEPDSIQPCCDIMRFAPPKVTYTGGEFPLEDYKKAIASASAGNRKADGPCRTCPLLKKVNKAKDHSILLKTILINHQRSVCNAKCVYCDFWKQPTRSYNINPTIVDLFKSNILADNACFHWGGGEPTLLPEFEETSEFIFSRNRKQSVCTNAIRYSEQTAKLLGAGACSILVSLDCGTRDSYEAIHGVDKFDDVVANLKRYAASSNDINNISLKYILFKENDREDEIVEFLKICRDIKCTNVLFSLDFEEVFANRVSPVTLDMAARIPAIAASYDIDAKFFYDSYYKDIIAGHQDSRKEQDSIVRFSTMKTFLKRLSNSTIRSNVLTRYLGL